MRGPPHTLDEEISAGKDIKTPNTVWGSAITYVRIVSGFVYLVVILFTVSISVYPKSMVCVMSHLMEAASVPRSRGRSFESGLL